jgi:hypothetical protein
MALKHSFSSEVTGYARNKQVGDNDMRAVSQWLERSQALEGLSRWTAGPVYIKTEKIIR